MIRRPTLSYGQLYKLFGYRKTVDVSSVIEELFSAISVIEVSQIPLFQAGEASITPVVYSFHFAFRKERLNKYLSHKMANQRLYRLDARMHVIQLKKAELKNTKWYQPKHLKLRFELFKLLQPRIPIADAFAFFAYKAQQMGLSKQRLHERMEARAENYSADNVI